MGVQGWSSDDIELGNLYENHIDLSNLMQPFSSQEIYDGIKNIPRDKSPGLDGFGSGFFQDFWPIIKEDISIFFTQFYSGSLQLERINRSFMILLRKKDNDSSSGAFRPISLLNCLVKWITKVLAARLQLEITKLVDVDQSGFVKTRCIADNFMYAMDLVQTCRRRKRKAIILKLDFRKAFDTVSWSALFKILSVRGFDDTWCMWMRNLLHTSKTAIILNVSLGSGLTLRRA